MAKRQQQPNSSAGGGDVSIAPFWERWSGNPDEDEDEEDIADEYESVEEEEGGSSPATPIRYV